MPSKKTTNYKLSQWVKSDKVLMDDFNADNAAIDTAIKKVDDRLTTVAGGKADQSALDDLKKTVTSHTTALSGKGNCRIYTTSYTGTGTHSHTDPRKLTFPGKPEIVFIAQRGRDGVAMTAIYGQTYVVTQGFSPVANTVSWSGNTMSWSSASTSASQLDQANNNYDVVALIAES